MLNYASNRRIFPTEHFVDTNPFDDLMISANQWEGEHAFPLEISGESQPARGSEVMSGELHADVETKDFPAPTGASRWTPDRSDTSAVSSETLGDDFS